MKSRKQKVPGAFGDVAACFSEEEWRLLHHWQKQLYKNVMQEIHRAMSSLGPAIAASVFSLRPQDLSSVELVDLQIPSGVGASAGRSDVVPVVSLSLKQEGQLYPVERRDSGERESFGSLTSHSSAESEPHLEGIQGSGKRRRCCDDLNRGNVLKLKEEWMSGVLDHSSSERGRSSKSPGEEHSDVEPVISCNIKQEEELYPVDSVDCVRREGVGGTTRFPSLHTETEASYGDCQWTGPEAAGICCEPGPEVTAPGAAVRITPERDTCITNVQEYHRRENPKGCGGPEVTSPEAAVRITPERDTYIVDVQEYHRRESPKGCGDVGSMKRKRNMANSFSKLFKSLPTQSDTSMTLGTHERRCSGSDWEVREEQLAPWESGFPQPAHTSACEPPEVQLLGAYTTCDSTASNNDDSPCPAYSLQTSNQTSTKSEPHTGRNRNRRAPRKVKGTCTWWPPAMYIYHDTWM